MLLHHSGRFCHEADKLYLQGDDGTTEFGWRNDKGGPKKNIKAVSGAEQRLAKEVNANCRIYFPTQNTVARSKGGTAVSEAPFPGIGYRFIVHYGVLCLWYAQAGGTICFQAKWYSNPQFPRSLLRDSESKRGVLSHDKIIYVRPTSANTLNKAWAYIGSANLSESAW